MQFMNRLNILSDSHLEIPKIPFAKNPFSTPLSQLLSLSSCSSILLSRFFFLQRILPTATRFPLFHPAQAISLSSQLSLFFLSSPSSRSLLFPLFHFCFLSKLKPPLFCHLSLSLMSHLAATTSLIFRVVRSINQYHPKNATVRGVYKYAPLR